MTNEQIVLIEQLLITGVASKQVKILGGKAEISLTSLTTGDQLRVESEMRSIEGTPAFMVHTYSLKLVSQILKSFTSGGKQIDFKTAQEAYDFIISRPSSVVDAIIGEHTKFEKELALLAKMDTLAENFTEAPTEELKQN